MAPRYRVSIPKGFYTMAYQISQLTLEEFSNKYMNLKHAKGGTSSDFSSNEFKFGLTYSKLHLDDQAQVFSDELFTRSNFDLRKIFNSNSTTVQLQHCKECYIYSYAKSLLLGLNANDVNTLPTNSPVFVGHGILHRLLSQSRFNLTKEDYSLYMSIEVSRAEKEELTCVLFHDYNFLNKCSGYDSAGCFAFRSTFHDQMLNKLLDSVNNIYVKRTISKSPSSVPSTVRVASSEEDNSASDKTEDENFLDHTDPAKDKNAGNTRLTINKGMRTLEMFSLDDDDLDGFLSDEQLPLGNSALSITNGNMWHYSFTRNEGIFNSLSYHICRANFIFIRDSSDQFVFDNERFYSRLPRKFEKDHLVTKDVRSITYLKVNSMLRRTSGSQNSDTIGLLFNPNYQWTNMIQRQDNNGNDIDMPSE
jgi:hypothetical protein